jgi:hypothetical protein
MAIPTAAIRLPRRAVLGWVTSRSPKMKQMNARM